MVCKVLKPGESFRDSNISLNKLYSNCVERKCDCGGAHLVQLYGAQQFVNSRYPEGVSCRPAQFGTPGDMLSC